MNVFEVTQRRNNVATILIGLVFVPSFLAVILTPLPAIAQASSICSGISPTALLSSTTPVRLSHPHFESKGWKVMLRTGPSTACSSGPIWADDNLPVEERGTYVGVDQSWSLLRFRHNGGMLERWAETRFIEVDGASGGCIGALPSIQFNPPRSWSLSHPQYEAQGWKVMLRTGPSMDCSADPIWADDNLRVTELGAYTGVDQSWSLLRFIHNGSTKQRWAETRFLANAGGSGACSGASPSTVFSTPRSRTLSHPEFETRGWLVMLRSGPSIDCGANPIWADDNLQVQQLGTYAGVNQSWSLLRFSNYGVTLNRWAESRFLE